MVGLFGSVIRPPGLFRLSAMSLIVNCSNSTRSEATLMPYLASFTTVSGGIAIWFAFSKNAIVCAFVNTIVVVVLVVGSDKLF